MSGPKPRDPKERFLEKVRKEPNGCWVWTARLERRGYAKFFFEGKDRWAHRVSWRLFRGHLPDDMLVCHTCDNPSCVSPFHLFLGSHQDNMWDMKYKKRHNHGEKHGMATLTEDIVRKIRDLHDERGFSQKEIAERLGLRRSLIGKIVRRERWKHVC